MTVRAVIVWLVILVLASVNGAVRDLLAAPRMGDTIARAISTILLCAVILLVTWLTIVWIRPTTDRAAWMVGVSWVGLTLAFEFLVGHFVSHKTWAELLADYDVARGRIWILVLVVTLLAPRWMAGARGLFKHHSSSSGDRSDVAQSAAPK